MKGLKKLALAAAVVAPFAHAEMTSIDDVMMSEMTGQAGITIDIDLAMTIGEVRYVDQDGFGTDQGDQGYLTFSNVQVGELTNAVTGASAIRGVTIDVDSARGIVIGLGHIGGATTQANHFWDGLDVRADFGINGAAAGSFKIDNITNFVPNALVVEGIAKFGYLPAAAVPVGTPGALAWTDSANAVNLTAFQSDYAAAYTAIMTDLATNGAASPYFGLPQTTLEAAAKQSAVANQGAQFTAGNYVDAWVAINAGGSDGAQGLTISASTGFVIEKIAYVDDGREMGIHNFTMFDTDATGNIIGFQVDGLTIDVVAYAGAASGSALKIGGATMQGNIIMGDIYIGDYVNGSIGGLAIKDIDMSATDIYVYGH